MRWKKLKTWQKGLIIGLIPLVLAIFLTLVLLIAFSVGFFSIVLILYLLFFYLFSFVFLIFAILIGLVIHKGWKIQVLVFLAFVLVPSLIIIHGFSGEPPPGEIKTYKGIWTPAFFMTGKVLLLDIEQLKEDGVNTLSFGPNYFTDDEGNVDTIPFMKQLTVLFVQTAHRNGFRVFLVPNLWGPGFSPEKIDRDLFFEQATKINLEWAEIAEKYGVEMYAPSNEPSIIVPDKEAVNKWAHDVAIKIRERYHGILVYKAAEEWGFDNDYSGYDYVGLDIFPHNQTLDEFREHVRFQVGKGSEFAERDGARGVMFSEIGVQVKVTMKGDITSTTDQPFSLDYQKEAYKIFFEEGEGNVSSYIFCCWDGSDFGPDGYPAEQVMKEWFHKIE